MTFFATPACKWAPAVGAAASLQIRNMPEDLGGAVKDVFGPPCIVAVVLGESCICSVFGGLQKMEGLEVVNIEGWCPFLLVDWSIIASSRSRGSALDCPPLRSRHVRGGAWKFVVTQLSYTQLFCPKPSILIASIPDSSTSRPSTPKESWVQKKWL